MDIFRLNRINKQNSEAVRLSLLIGQDSFTIGGILLSGS